MSSTEMLEKRCHDLLEPSTVSGQGNMLRVTRKNSINDRMQSFQNLLLLLATLRFYFNVSLALCPFFAMHLLCGTHQMHPYQSFLELNEEQMKWTISTLYTVPKRTARYQYGQCKSILSLLIKLSRYSLMCSRIILTIIITPIVRHAVVMIFFDADITQNLLLVTLIKYTLAASRSPTEFIGGSLLVNDTAVEVVQSTNSLLTSRSLRTCFLLYPSKVLPQRPPWHSKTTFRKPSPE